MCNANKMPTWRKMYILTTYMLPHIMYGSASHILTAQSIKALESNTAYKSLKAVFVATIKKIL